MKTKKESRTRTFTVPQEMIGSFFYFAETSNLHTKLIDAEPPHNIVVDVTYREEEREDVMILIEMLDDHTSGEDS